MLRTYVPHTFSADALAIIRQANQICAAYARQGYDLTLRQLYYQFVSRNLIRNKQSEYNRLGSIINDARLAGRLDWEYLVDRTRELDTLAHWDAPGGVIEAAARSYHNNLWLDQPIRVEVWVEKDALTGVLQRPCYDLDVPLFSCRGYTSQSEMWAAGRRIGKYLANGAEQVVILHLGDHDPSGIDMTRDINDRLRMFLRGDWLEDYDPYDDTDEDEEPAFDDPQEAIGSFLAWDWPEKGAGKPEDAEYEHGSSPWYDWPKAASKAFIETIDTYRNTWADQLTVKRIALTRDQINQYNPPPNPAKLTDARAQGYIAAHGTQSWELDALDPTVLDALVRDHVELHLDRPKFDAAYAKQEADRALLQRVATDWDAIVAALP